MKKLQNHENFFPFFGYFGSTKNVSQKIIFSMAPLDSSQKVRYMTCVITPYLFNLNIFKKPTFLTKVIKIIPFPKKFQMHTI